MTRNADKFQAWGYTYTADGWDTGGKLFIFDVDEPVAELGNLRARSILDIAQDHARHGVGGLATHGCQDVRAVGNMTGEPIWWAADRR